MTIALTHVHQVFATVAEAAVLAAQLNVEADDGWTYAVKPDPTGTGKALIAVFDETGAFVANL